MHVPLKRLATRLHSYLYCLFYTANHGSVLGTERAEAGRCHWCCRGLLFLVRCAHADLQGSCIDTHLSSLFGYDQGDLGGILTVQSFRTQFPQLDTISNPGDAHIASIQGITVAIWNIGCFVSAIITMLLGDILGRRKTMFIGLTFLIIGEIIQCTSFSFGQLLAGRFIAGFGNGFNTATVPAWQAECTKAHRRGTLLMITAGAFIAAGLSFSYWMAFAFAWLDPSSAAWRVPIAIQLFIALIVLGLLIAMPESPRWLILSGREQEALDVLSALNDQSPDDSDVHQEFIQIKDAVIEMARGSFSTMFTMGEYRYLHRTILAFVLQIFQQISG